GAVHVLSAYCPHLGANLGVGGHVVTESESGDDCIQCPFHGWMFGGRDGQCKSIPNLEKSELKPLNARVKCWPVIEKNEMIYVWYHSGDQEPDHYPPDLSVKYNNPKLTLLSTINYNIYTTPQQVIENLLDTEHLQYVHTVIIPGIVSLKYYTSGEGTWDKPLTIRADILVFGIYVCRIQYDYRAVTPAYGEYEYSSVGAPGVTPLVMILSGVCLGPEKSLINTRLLGTPTLWTRIFVWLFHYLFYLQPKPKPGSKSTYANTWYIIMDSRDLATNSVKAFELCEQQLVAFRGPSGAVHVLSAYCPHLGANLGVGGHVVTESESGDDCIQCPFHGWRFGGDGQCKRIPNLEKSELKPLNARVKCWPVMEKNEMIYMWYHSSDQEPDHFLPDLSVKYNNPKLTLLSTFNYNIYNIFQQVIENLLDTEHFEYVHTVVFSGIISAKYYTSGEGTEDNPLHIRVDLLVFGVRFTYIEYDYRALTPAYGELMFTSVGLPGVTQLVMTLSGVTLGPDNVLMTTRLLGTPTLWMRIAVWLFHRLFRSQALEDKVIWDNLVCPQTPVLTKHDRKIVHLRRLLQKFYD
ncbi:unnamed protein product, partial [Medioppia subpectinata]